MTESKTACALLVQLVERRSPKPDVGGSSPPGRAQEQKTKPEIITQAAKIAVSVNSFGHSYCICSCFTFSK